MKSDWSYPPFQPMQIPPGHFKIYVHGAEKNRLSACACEIVRFSDGHVVCAPDALVTESATSTQWRGHWAAAVRAFELIPLHSHGAICSSNLPLLAVLDDLWFYRDNEWMKRDGKPLADSDIIARLERALGADGSLRKMSTLRPQDQDDIAALKRLRSKVADSLNRRFLRTHSDRRNRANRGSSDAQGALAGASVLNTWLLHDGTRLGDASKEKLEREIAYEEREAARHRTRVEQLRALLGLDI